MTDREELYDQLDSLESRFRELGEKSRRVGRFELMRRMQEKEAWCRRKKILLRLDDELPPPWLYAAIPFGAAVLVLTLYALIHWL